MIALIAYFAALIGLVTLMYCWLYRMLAHVPYEENFDEWKFKGGGK